MKIIRKERSERVKVCPSCNKCWEVYISDGYNSNVGIQIMYELGHLNTYGKERIVCKICLKN